jgi:4-hydroxyphenylacetate 3-monooxygenase
LIELKTGNIKDYGCLPRMKRTGNDYLAALDDGRRVFLADRLVTNPAKDIAFSRAAATIASLYDLQIARAGDATVVDKEARWEGGQWILSRNIDELRYRRRHIEAWADVHKGFMGRTPDMGASMLSGMVMGAEILRAHEQRGTQALEDFYHYARSRDLFVAHAVIPPQWGTLGARVQRTVLITERRQDGIVLSGARSVATAALFADEIFVSSIRTIAQGAEQEAFATMVPPSAPGLTIVARESFEFAAVSRQDSPLAWQFDETDALLHFDAVFVPWERVFSHGSPELCRLQYFATPAHVLQNYQAQIRLLAKIRFMLALAHRLADINGLGQMAAVQEKLGRLGADCTMIEAGLSAMEVYGERIGCWYVPSARFLYASMATTQPVYGRCVDLLRELAGASGVGAPESASFRHPEVSHVYQLISGGDLDAFMDRARLLRLLQEVIGSAFGARHEQYERFYAGPPHVVAQNAYRTFGWERYGALLDCVLTPKEDITATALT